MFLFYIFWKEITEKIETHSELELSSGESTADQPTVLDIESVKDNSENDLTVTQITPGSTCEKCQQLNAECERIKEEKDEAENLYEQLNNNFNQLQNDYQSLATKNNDLAAVANSGIERFKNG
jgi:archaellum component FlaC